MSKCFTTIYSYRESLRMQYKEYAETRKNEERCLDSVSCGPASI